MKCKLSFLFGLLLAGLIGSAGHIYRSRTIVRIPTPESMDNPEIAEAFNRVAG